MQFWIFWMDARVVAVNLAKHYRPMAQMDQLPQLLSNTGCDSPCHHNHFGRDLEERPKSIKGTPIINDRIKTNGHARTGLSG